MKSLVEEYNKVCMENDILKEKIKFGTVGMNLDLRARNVALTKEIYQLREEMDLRIEAKEIYIGALEYKVKDLYKQLSTERNEKLAAQDKVKFMEGQFGKMKRRYDERYESLKRFYQSAYPNYEYWRLPDYPVENEKKDYENTIKQLKENVEKLGVENMKKDTTIGEMELKINKLLGVAPFWRGWLS